jgi:hypothetical protein
MNQWQNVETKRLPIVLWDTAGNEGQSNGCWEADSSNRIMGRPLWFCQKKATVAPFEQ